GPQSGAGPARVLLLRPWERPRCSGRSAGCSSPSGYSAGPPRSWSTWPTRSPAVARPEGPGRRSARGSPVGARARPAPPWLIRPDRRPRSYRRRRGCGSRPVLSFAALRFGHGHPSMDQSSLGRGVFLSIVLAIVGIPDAPGARLLGGHRQLIDQLAQPL